MPAGSILYVAPEMVSHYVNVHEYLPPKDFVEAVMAGPLPGCNECRAAPPVPRLGRLVEQ